MQSNLQNEFSEFEEADGFNLIPPNPNKVFVLKLNPLLHNLRTELVLRKNNKWRLPCALSRIDKRSVVILWQDGPNAGGYGIAIPAGQYFMTDSYFYSQTTHLEFYRCSFKEAKCAASTFLPSNGLLLCAVHHKLFDAGLIRLSVFHAKRAGDSGYVIRVLAPNSLFGLSKADIDYVKKLDWRAPHVPERKQHRPKAEFLEFRKNLSGRKVFARAAREGWRMTS